MILENAQWYSRVLRGGRGTWESLLTTLVLLLAALISRSVIHQPFPEVKVIKPSQLPKPP